MGKRLSKFTPNYIKNFNIENRTQRYLDKQKTIPAPRYPTTIKLHKEQEGKFLDH